ncbi:hypothetical protein LSM04_003873 [Trypanosoma melophagium]|uniref:uncharacterized protein n=1 Tax=Trypanosoma melophagium TaxID=715481 RepID=UPI00351A74BC|nr:hypothetical protein LSM04_003873 [Trypanosoma melophagium]
MSAAVIYHQEHKEVKDLLFRDESMRVQMFSELSLLVLSAFNQTDQTDFPEPLKLRLMMHVMDVISKYPALGTLLVCSPRNIDAIMTGVLMPWLLEEASAAITKTIRREGGGIQFNGLPSSGCWHTVSKIYLSNIHSGPENDDCGCPICPWTLQWPLSFWESLRSGRIRVNVYISITSFPSFLVSHTEYLPLKRPSDLLVGAEQWVEVIGEVTGIFFLHRESNIPEPMVELRPLLSSRDGVARESTIWLDLSLLPSSDVQASAIVGERIQAMGFLEITSDELGTMLYSKSGNNSSSGQIILETRTIRTANFVSQWSQDPLKVLPSVPNVGVASMTSPSFANENCFSITNEENEMVALLQAKCSWESVAGAAAFASAKNIGGFKQDHSKFHPQALFAASKVFVLPTSLWAAIGITLTSATVPDGTIATSVVGSSDILSVLQTFLLELGSETNLVLPLLHGMENTLLPMYTRMNVSQLSIPINVEAGQRIEMVRGGLLNAAYKRVLFAPSLHTVTPSAIHAVQGVLEEHEHVVIREGGQRLVCRATGSIIVITQELQLVQNRHLFQFVERGDVVVSVPSSSFLPVQNQAELLLQMFPIVGENEDSTVFDFVDRCTNQWDTWCRWALTPSVNEPSIPQLSSACAALLHAFFLSVKANCAQAADASMMTSLVKFTWAHALMRQRLHQKSLNRKFMTTDSSICLCRVINTNNDKYTALIDAIVAIALCDASLKFIGGISLIGEPSVFDSITGNGQFDVVQFAKQLHEYLLSTVPGEAM